MLAVTVLITALPARGQETSVADRRAVSQQQGQNYTVLHVDAAAGNDQQGSGSVQQPYKTITRALQVAPNTTSAVILLAPGHYSQASGEHFPLHLRPGLTIQGQTGETRNTMIVGSGDFQSTNQRHNAAIVMSDRSGLANVVVSNPQGSGVWITVGTPILRRVALVANAVAGVQVFDGAPVIEHSYFHRNHHGLTVQGNSRAMVRENYFEATGRAITVTSPAIPRIHNNRIARNDVGITLKNNARPVLEANVLNGNSRNGVLEVEPTVEPTVATLGSGVPAIGGSEAADDANSPAAVPVREAEDDANLSAAVPAREEPAAREELAVFTPTETSTEAETADVIAPSPPLDDSISIAVIPAAGPVSNDPVLNHPMDDERREGVSKLLARLNRRSTIAAPLFAAPLSEDTIDNGAVNRLPVPSVAIPSGNTSSHLTPPGTVSLAGVFRYQVLVEMADAEQLQTLVPDAFRTRVGSRMFMQAGAYVEETEAQERLDWLREHGIDGSVNLRE